MVSTCPTPMKRSRVFTRHAMMSENVANSVAARTTMTSTLTSASGLQFSFTPSNSERPYTIAVCESERMPAEKPLPSTRAGSDEVQIGNVAGVHRPAAGKHLPEDEQPERRLEGPSDQFREIVAQLAQL